MVDLTAVVVEVGLIDFDLVAVDMVGVTHLFEIFIPFGDGFGPFGASGPQATGIRLGFSFEIGFRTLDLNGFGVVVDICGGSFAFFTVKQSEIN